MPRLILLRGNSGSGKTTVARALQRRFGQNTMLISQDAVRRDMLRAKDGENTPALPLLTALLEYGAAHSGTTILEGILRADWYRPLLVRAAELYGENLYAYYFDLPFEETLRRHQTKPNRAEFGEKELRDWWREKDFSDALKEQILPPEKNAEEIVEEIYRRARGGSEQSGADERRDVPAARSGADEQPGAPVARSGARTSSPASLSREAARG